MARKKRILPSLSSSQEDVVELWTCATLKPGPNNTTEVIKVSGNEIPKKLIDQGDDHDSHQKSSRLGAEIEYCPPNKPRKPCIYNLRKSAGMSYGDAYTMDNHDFTYCKECDKHLIGTCSLHAALVLNKKIERDGSVKERARLTAPWPLTILESGIPGAGEGVWTQAELPHGLIFGPYEGRILTYNLKGKDSGYAWHFNSTVHGEQLKPSGKKKQVVDSLDKSFSNWLRYVNCARSMIELNLEAFQYKGNIYYRTLSHIARDTELLVWYGDEYGKDLGITNFSYTMPSIPRLSGEQEYKEIMVRKKLNNNMNNNKVSSTADEKIQKSVSRVQCSWSLSSPQEAFCHIFQPVRLQPSEDGNVEVVNDNSSFEVGSNMAVMTEAKPMPCSTIPHSKQKPRSKHNHTYCVKCKTSLKWICKKHPMTLVLDKPVCRDGSVKERAILTTPWPLAVTGSQVKGAGLGVFTSATLPPGLVFGPCEGKIIRKTKKMTGYGWEIRGRPDIEIDSQDTSVSNWTRYINCARNYVERNLIAMQHSDEIFYVTSCTIPKGRELLVWYGTSYGNWLGITMKDFFKSKPPDKGQWPCGDCGMIFFLKESLINHCPTCPRTLHSQVSSPTPAYIRSPFELSTSYMPIGGDFKVPSEDVKTDIISESQAEVDKVCVDDHSYTTSVPTRKMKSSHKINQTVRVQGQNYTRYSESLCNMNHHKDLQNNPSGDAYYLQTSHLEAKTSDKYPGHALSSTPTSDHGNLNSLNQTKTTSHTSHCHANDSTLTSDHGSLNILNQTKSFSGSHHDQFCSSTPISEHGSLNSLNQAKAASGTHHAHASSSTPTSNSGSLNSLNQSDDGDGSSDSSDDVCSIISSFKYRDTSISLKGRPDPTCSKRNTVKSSSIDQSHKRSLSSNHKCCSCVTRRNVNPSDRFSSLDGNNASWYASLPKNRKKMKYHRLGNKKQLCARDPAVNVKGSTLRTSSTFTGFTHCSPNGHVEFLDSSWKNVNCGSASQHLRKCKYLRNSMAANEYKNHDSDRACHHMHDTPRILCKTHQFPRMSIGNSCGCTPYHIADSTCQNSVHSFSSSDSACVGISVQGNNDFSIPKGSMTYRRVSRNAISYSSHDPVSNNYETNDSGISCDHLSPSDHKISSDRSKRPLDRAELIQGYCHHKNARLGKNRHMVTESCGSSSIEQQDHKIPTVRSKRPHDRIEDIQRHSQHKKIRLGKTQHINMYSQGNTRFDEQDSTLLESHCNICNSKRRMTSHVKRNSNLVESCGKLLTRAQNHRGCISAVNKKQFIRDLENIDVHQHTAGPCLEEVHVDISLDVTSRDNFVEDTDRSNCSSTCNEGVGCEETSISEKRVFSVEDISQCEKLSMMGAGMRVQHSSRTSKILKDISHEHSSTRYQSHCARREANRLKYPLKHKLLTDSDSPENSSKNASEYELAEAHSTIQNTLLKPIKESVQTLATTSPPDFSPQLFQCSSCGMNFMTKYSLVQHKNTYSKLHPRGCAGY